MDIKKVLALDPATNTHRVGFEFDASGEATLGVVIVSVDSPQYKAEEKRQRMETAVERAKNKGKKIDTGSAEFQEELSEKFDHYAIRRAVAVTVDWFGFTDGKKAAEFSPEMAKQLYERFSGWRGQVLMESERTGNFLPK